MIGLLKQSWNEFSSDNCMQMAAALSYYTIFSLPPLLVVLISVAGFFVETERVEQRLDNEIEAVVGEGGTKQIDTMIQQAQQPGRGLWGTIIGVVMLLFGATGVMVQLQAAMNQAWGVEPDPEAGGLLNFVVKRMLSLAMILAIAFLLLVSLVATMILNGLDQQISSWLPWGLGSEVISLTQNIVSFGVITVLFAGMFKYLPDAQVAWRDVWVGAAVTALLFVIARWGLGLYLGRSSINSTYGAAGALALLMIWVYYSGVIFLFGAELTEVWSRRRGRGIEPEPGAHLIDSSPSPTE